VADREDEQIPGPGQGNCSECGSPLAPDQRYCLSCGARRGRLPGAVAGTLAALSSKGRGVAAAAGAKLPKSKGGDGEEGGWSWMPSPPAIAIAVIGMLALGVGLGSAMSEIAESAPLQTILLVYPHHATEAPPAEEPEEEVEEEAIAAAPVETAPEAIPFEPLPEEAPFEPLPEGEEELDGQPPPAEFNPEEEGENFLEEEELPEVRHAWLIVLGENSYESLFGGTGEAAYTSKTLPKKGELIPNYYGVTGGVLANQIAMLSGQGPTQETAVNCPNYDEILPGTVAETAEQVEGTGCVYAETVKSLPTELGEEEVTWRAYVEDMENGAAAGWPTTCRKPTLNTPDPAQTPVVGDQFVTWRNPVVYFRAIAESPECGKLDVGFEALTRDLKSKKKTPALSLIYPDACHAGGELECEPGAPKGARGVAALLKTLVPAIMASPAYEEGGGLIMITSAQAPQTGEGADPSGCCLAPQFPNLPSAGTTTKKATSGKKSSTATTEAEAEPTAYSEESVTETGGGGKVGLLLISPLVEPGTVAEAEYGNHFTLLKTLATMFGVEPVGFAAEEEVPTLSPSLFVAPEEEAQEAAETSRRKARASSATPRNLRMVGPVKRRDRRAPNWAPGSTPIERAIARLRP